MRIERPVRTHRAIDKLTGKVTVPLADIIVRARVAFEGYSHLPAIEQQLQSGSVLIVSDHPSTLSTIFPVKIIHKLQGKKQVGLLMNKRFQTGEMKAIGYVALQMIEQLGYKPFFVHTKKYQPDENERRELNKDPIEQFQNLLREPGSVGIIYASGTRQTDMGEAEKGIRGFARVSDMVVPVSTVIQRGHKPQVIVHEPILGKRGIEWCTREFNELGGEAFSDLVMTIIASGQPDEEKRGFYRPYCEALIKLQNGDTANVTDITDARIRRCVQTYIGWRGNFQ